jgi:hypothetical protein
VTMPEAIGQQLLPGQQQPLDGLLVVSASWTGQSRQC